MKNNNLSINQEYEQIRNIEDYYLNFIRKIIKKVHVMKCDQIIRALMIKFEIKGSNARRLLLLAQRRNILAISTDYYAMTIQYYKMITDDVFLDRLALNDLNNNIVFPIYPMIEYHERNLIKCLDVVVEMMPYSEDFIVTPSPFIITFDVPFIENEKESIQSAVYQITFFDDENFLTKTAMVEAVGKVEDYKMQKIIKRIAIVESTDKLYLIPHMGYSKIILSTDEGIEIIEKRDTPWL